MEAASNAGIRASESKYILIHDDDDSLDPNFLEETVRYLESTNWPTISAVATWVMRIEEKIVGNDIVEMKRHIFLPLAPCISIDEMARFNPCPPISLLFRRDAYLRVGPFDESLPVLGDWDFGIRLISRFDIGVIQKPLANYHLRPGITGGNLANTLYSIMDKHRFFDPLIRNRYARSEEHLAVGRLIQRHALRHPVDELARLYRHVVIGRIIYLWSKYVNSRIPPHPDNV
jgi:glycosyltransferase involved in cell wall biosynthesis